MAQASLARPTAVPLLGDSVHNAHNIPPMGAGINGWFRVGLHAASHIQVAAYTARSHLGKRPIVLIFLAEHHDPDFAAASRRRRGPDSSLSNCCMLLSCAYHKGGV